MRESISNVRYAFLLVIPSLAGAGGGEGWILTENTISENLPRIYLLSLQLIVQHHTMAINESFIAFVASYLEKTGESNISILLWSFAGTNELTIPDGFQLLHAIYAVERFLENLVKRHCNFHIAFFEGTRFPYKGHCNSNDVPPPAHFRAPHFLSSYPFSYIGASLSHPLLEHLGNGNLWPCCQKTGNYVYHLE